MVKKIMLIIAVLLCNISFSSERNKSPKPFATLGAFLKTNRPITINGLIDETKALEVSHFANFSDEIKRYEQLERNYEMFCDNLKNRGQKEQHDKFKKHAAACRAKINKLIELELNNLDNQIYDIINNETLGEKPYRWVATRPLYVKIVEIAPKDSEQRKEAVKTLEYIDSKKQPIANQLDLIKRLKAENNLQGMINAYQTLQLLTPENTAAINDRIVELRSQAAKEAALSEVSCCIAAINTEEGTKQARLEKIVDYCNRTIANTSSVDVKALCETERLHYKKTLTHLELENTPTLCANEFIHTAFVRTIEYSDSLGLNDVRAMIAEERQINFNFDDEDTPSTAIDTIGLQAACHNAIDAMEKIVNTAQSKRTTAIRAALEKVEKNRTSTHLVMLANAYHDRAEFNQKYYSDTCKGLIDRDRYDAKATGLQAFSKDSKAREQLKFNL